jgi:hypothetical protein
LNRGDKKLPLSTISSGLTFWFGYSEENLMTGHIPTLFGFRTALKDLYLGKYYTGAAGKLDF